MPQPLRFSGPLFLRLPPLAERLAIFPIDTGSHLSRPVDPASPGLVYNGLPWNKPFPGVLPSNNRFAPVAQWIEHLTTDQKVRGSTPLGRANSVPRLGVSGGVDLPEAPIHGFSKFLHEWIV